MNHSNESSLVSSSEKSTTEENIGLKVFFICLFVSISLLHLIIQFIIQKKRLHDNQYYLIRVLSLTDLFVVVTSCVLVVNTLFQFTNRIGLVFISMLIYIGLSYSLIVTLIIAFDRWIAVKWCLQYYTLFSRVRINTALVILGVINAVILSYLFYMYEVENSSGVMKTFYLNDGTVMYVTFVRTVSCVLLIVMGKLTIYLRDQSEIKMKLRTNLHGAEAEQLDRTKQLKRSIKDVFKLNLWTCIFLLPMIITSAFFISTISQEKKEHLLLINGFVTYVYNLSNPIIYLTCFSKIRLYLMSLFQRQVIPDANVTQQEPENFDSTG
ncbi:adenosine receptor A3-like [Clytia hemisphaerica]|uniref:adenosine receptor A3-like n=1 Tax=Clytia hemisphaerica TaxID=252671 RepID=UPI0034D6F8D2